ncbi:hypothetical protein QBC34DRAFT_428745 [Podospora aff. communis PSN243]|uniref:XPA C-terminal domain-containing protein n=1 Tax=Podospora aff. communis PSN243 TaxID=3040156 RepID=A0AAV9GC65_9PEZI|nr:hypothetical protein QBC34DRAFT_428745 [Podospora aff. communis PSN243]
MTYRQLHALEVEADPLAHLMQTRHIVGRPATAARNPRGKHHRNPLPWDRRKLTTACGWSQDATEYRKWQWETEKEIQRESERLEDRRHAWEPMDTVKSRQKPKGQRPKPKPKSKSAPKPPKHDPSTTSGDIDDRFVARKKRLIQKGVAQDPHFLTLVDAFAKRNRMIYFKCGCCYDLSWSDSVRWWREYWGRIMEEGMGDAVDLKVVLPGGGWKGTDGAGSNYTPGDLRPLVLLLAFFTEKGEG